MSNPIDKEFPKDTLNFDDDGLLNGEYKSYYHHVEGGGILEEGKYLHGRKDGLWMDYTKHGSKWLWITWDNGLIQGRIVWHEDNEVSGEGYYNNDIQEGEHINYNEYDCK
jgi:antitoxin component YwqK of YwqJK toxin-antitoxin module